MNDRRIASRRMGRVAHALALVVALAGLGACGGKKQLDVSFTSEQEQTVWVVVAVVDDPDALAGYKTSDIFRERDTIGEKPGVYDAIAVPISPGRDVLREIPTADISTEKAWVVAVGNFAGESTCSRRTLEIKARSHLTVAVGLRNDCLELTSE